MQKEVIELQRIQLNNADKQLFKKSYAAAISNIKPKPKRVPKITKKLMIPNKNKT